MTLIDGEPISPGRLLGQHVDCNFFQDLGTFLRNHGQRGPQSTILPPGTYRLNTRAVFVNAELDEHSHEKVADQPAPGGAAQQGGHHHHDGRQPAAAG